MRFVITGEWRRNSLLRLIIVLFLLYTAGLWVTNALLYFNKMKLTPTSVVEYYLGSEERFTRPRTYQGLLEISHFHLFAMGILILTLVVEYILTLTHLVLFVPLPVRLKFWLLLVSFGTAIANEAGGWLVRYVHPAFAYWKIAAFLGFQISLAVLIIAVLIATFGRTRNAYTDDA